MLMTPTSTVSMGAVCLVRVLRGGWMLYMCWCCTNPPFRVGFAFADRVLDRVGWFHPRFEIGGRCLIIQPVAVYSIDFCDDEGRKDNPGHDIDGACAYGYPRWEPGTLLHSKI